MPFFGRRIAETFIFEIVLSAIFTIVIQFIGATNKLFSVFMIVALTANVVYMFICLRAYYFTEECYQFYFKVNLTVYLLFGVVNIIMAYFNLEPFYTYMFFPYKLFMQVGFTKIVSALIVNAIFVVEILFAKILFNRLSAW